MIKRFGVVAALCLVNVAAMAQTWPGRPVTFIVSQAAGASPDIFCRIITDRLTQELGQAFIVENRAGAGNIVGLQAAARAAPDGYTFVFATSAALTTNLFTVKNLPYDPVRSFTPVAFVSRSAIVMLADPKLPAASLKELIAYEKSQSGKLSVGVDGARNLSGIIAQSVNKAAGTNFILVPYTNIPTAIQDTMTGRTQATIQSASVAEPFIKQGALRPIAVAGPKRISALPQVPTISESLPGIELSGWFMVLAPAGTPDDIVQKLNKAIAAIVSDPAIQSRAKDLGFEVDQQSAGTPADAGTFLKSELAVWEKLVQDLGIEPQ